MKVKIELLSNTVFGSGKSVPGAEDISVLTDKDGFPFFRGATFKGILREEVENIIDWTGKDKNIVDKIFGSAGEHAVAGKRIIVSDFEISEYIKGKMLSEEGISKTDITKCFTGTYTFTKIKDGTAEDGSLRSCRYINKGVIFYGEIKVDNEFKDIISDGLKAVKYIGTMRTRGFGRVKVSEVGK